MTLIWNITEKSKFNIKNILHEIFIFSWSMSIFDKYLILKNILKLSFKEY